MAHLSDHAKGCMAGLFVGDASGATLEFYRGKLTKEQIKESMSMRGGGALNVAPGQVTDDSELAIHLYRALSSTALHSPFPLDKVAKEYIDWHKSGPFDMGRTCGMAFGSASDAESMTNNAAKYNMLSEANGSLMRIAPLAMWAYSWATPKEIIDMARLEATLSHPNRRCQDANAMYCLALSYVLKNHGDSKGAVHLCDSFVGDMDEMVQQWYSESKNDGCIKNLDCSVNVGHVRYAFTLAFYFLRKETPFERAIYKILKKRGDTDTNAAIIGAMMGAFHGLSAIPNYMLDPVLSFDCSKCDPSKALLGYWRPKVYKVQQYVMGVLPPCSAPYKAQFFLI